MTTTFDIRGPDGTTVELDVEEFTPLKQTIWATKAPQSLTSLGAGEHDVEVGPEIIEFLIELVEEQTVLTEELIHELEQDELNRLFQGVVSISFGEEFDSSREKIELDDGGIDLDEYR